MQNRRLKREKETVNSMIGLYCRARHKPANESCDECNFLVVYSNKRLDHCVFGAHKPACSKCPVHCYSTDRREAIKRVMRYAGPRMIFSHPYLTMMHIVDKHR
jgi:hypothetical protein